MKYLKQFGIILVLSFIGELLNHVLPLPVPSSIYGIILMFICLKTGLIPLEEVDETGRFLTVGGMEYHSICMASVSCCHCCIYGICYGNCRKNYPVYDSPNFTTTICNRIRSSRRRTRGRRLWLWNFLTALSFSG